MKFDIEAAKAAAMERHYAEFPDERPAGPKPTGATGPRTQAGKQRSSHNAYKHGLTGQIHLFTPEEHADFEKHCKSIVEALAPVGNLEQQLAQSIAENHWRLNRARAIESGIFALGQLKVPDEPFDPDMLQAFFQAKTWLAEGKNIQLLTLYEQRIQRSIERSMAELRTLRAERLAARQRAVEEAILLSQLAKSKGETHRPAADFPSQQFVFSSAEMEPLIHRNERLNEARDYAKTSVKPKSARQMPATA